MRISVIIPAFNAGITIGETLGSILAQSRPPDDIVVVDDGSTDTTAVIASRFAGVRVVSQSNCGPVVAMNSGLMATGGALVAFLDADDLWTPHNLAVHAAILAVNPGVAASVGQVEEFIDPSVDPETAATLLPRPAQPGWVGGATVVRRTLFEKVGMFNPALRIGGWIDWIDRARRAGAEFRVHDNLALRRRLRPGTLSSDERRASDLLQVARLAIRRRRTEA